MSLVTSAATNEEIIPRNRAAKAVSSLFMRFLLAGFPPQPYHIIAAILLVATENTDFHRPRIVRQRRQNEFQGERPNCKARFGIVKTSDGTYCAARETLIFMEKGFPQRLRLSGKVWRLPVMVLLTFPAALQAQFAFTTNNGAITITGYTGSDSAVVIPSTTNGWPVTSIGDYAFALCGMTSVTIPNSVTIIGDEAFNLTGLTNVNIPNSVTIIGPGAFASCVNLTSATLPNNVTNMGSEVFGFCPSLTSVMISNGTANLGTATFYSCTSLASIILPDSITNIGDDEFYFCTNLTHITIPNSVTSIGSVAFGDCFSLTNITIPGSVASIASDSFDFNSTAFNSTNMAAIYFRGNAPQMEPPGLFSYTNVTIYYLPNTTGWSNTLAGIPAFLWNPQAQTSDDSFGVRMNQFEFNITGTTNIPIVVEACTNLGGAWIRLESASLTNGSFYFSDLQWTNYPSRFYRIRSP